MNLKQYSPMEDYIIEQKLGSGSYCQVRQCVEKKTQTKRAIKIIEKKHCKSLSVVENELRILPRLNHCNVATLIDSYETPDNLFLILELVEGGDLLAELFDNGAFSEEKTHCVFVQLVSAMAYLHENRVTHRDIKCENILISKWNDRIKLTDFGLSKICSSDEQMMTTRCGTPSYVAPEIINGLPYSNTVDIWSLGIVLYLMLHCSYPYTGHTMEEIHSNILEGNLQFSDEPVISEEAKDLIRCLLNPNPKERLSIDQIFNHKWTCLFSNPSNKEAVK